MQRVNNNVHEIMISFNFIKYYSLKCSPGNWTINLGSLTSCGIQCRHVRYWYFNASIFLWENQAFLIYSRILSTVLKLGEGAGSELCGHPNHICSCSTWFLLKDTFSLFPFPFTQWILSKLEEVRENQPKS